MRGFLCIILFSKCLHARPVLDSSQLPRECGTLAHCADAEPLCVKIKDLKNASVNHHFTLDKCRLQLLRCQPGRVEAAAVPMKFCQGDQLSKDAAVIKKRVRRHLEKSTTEGINKTLHNETTSAITQNSRIIGRSHVKKNNKAKRKRGRSLKKPSRDGFGAEQTQNKFNNKPKPVIRNHKNIRISKGFTVNKRRGRPHVPGSLAAPLDYGTIFNNPNNAMRQGYTMIIEPDDPGNVTEENGEANEGDVGGNEDGGVNEGDREFDEGDRGVNEGNGAADEGDGGKNEDGYVANENGGTNEGDGGENEGDGDANEGEGGVKDGDGGENEGDGGVNESDGEVDEANGKPDEGDREVNEEDGGTNEGDGSVNEDDERREVAKEENTDDLLWKGDNDEGNNADKVEGVGENDDNGNDGGDNVDNEGGDNVDNEGGNNEDNVIARVKELTNPELWNSIQNGLRGVSMKFNLAVNSGF